MNIKTIYATVLTAVLLFAGCSQRQPDDFPKLYPVNIHVAQNGTPLDDASIVLRPSDASVTPWTVGAKTDASGTATLWTHGKFKGAPAGKFKVIISKIVNEGEKEYLDALSREDAAAAQRIDVKSFSLVEDEFESETTTPLEIEITPKTRTIEIDAGPVVKNQRTYLK